MKVCVIGGANVDITATAGTAFQFGDSSEVTLSFRASDLVISSEVEKSQPKASLRPGLAYFCYLCNY